jgi:hypothetical protein
MKRLIIVLAMATACGCDSQLSSQADGLDPPQVKIAAKPKAKPDPEKQAFIKLVQENADDPTGLTILHWGPKVLQPAGGYLRDVKFRCNRVGNEAVGGPVMVETGEIFYRLRGISYVTLDRTRKTWVPSDGP